MHVRKGTGVSKYSCIFFVFFVLFLMKSPNIPYILSEIRAGFCDLVTVCHIVSPERPEISFVVNFRRQTDRRAATFDTYSSCLMFDGANYVNFLDN